MGNPFGAVESGLSSVGDALADSAKSVAKHMARDIPAGLSGANQVIGMPTLNTFRGAAAGHPADIAKVGVAAALAIPVARGGFETLRGAAEAERTGMLIADATRARRLIGTSQETAPWIQQAGRMSRLGQAPESASLRVRGLIAGGERGSMDVAKIAQFPDTMSNIARRVKGRVMGAISAQGTAGLAEKIAQTRAEIVKLGGTPPTGPFAAVSESKVAGVAAELAALPEREAAAQATKASFEGSRISDKAKRIGLSIMKGGEQGIWKLPGTRPIESGEVKAGVYSARNWAGTQRRAVAGEAARVNEAVMGAYGKSISELKTVAKTHAMRLPRN